ncbi:MAG: MFS transporter [Gammaproteobacteria bacterium]
MLEPRMLINKSPKPHLKSSLKPGLFNSEEWRHLSLLASVFMLRILGLMMAMPVLSRYAGSLAGSNPQKIGLILGAYGLMQALLQFPMGWLSDRWGRFPVLMWGMFALILGSVFSALAETANGLFLGRTIQGLSAIGGVMMASVADGTRPQVRAKAMGFLGFGLGMAFMFSICLGPLLSASYSIQTLFWLTAVLGIFNLILLACFYKERKIRDPEFKPAFGSSFVLDLTLIKFNLGACILHAGLILLFYKLEFLWRAHFDHDFSYAQGLALSVTLGLIGAVFLIQRQSTFSTKSWFFLVVAWMIAQAFIFGTKQKALFLVGLVIYFAVFSTLEAALPAAISRQSSLERRGANMGIHHSMLFLGVFFGSLFIGYAAKLEQGFFILSQVLGFFWLFVLKWPQALTTNKKEVIYHGKRR